MTLEQKRALLAHRHVKEIQQDDQKSYGTMVLKLPVLIRTAGLCQALHFVRSRKKDAVRELLLVHLAEQLHRLDSKIDGPENLLKLVREADLGKYLWLSREALATAEWYSRFAQSELKVERTDEDPSS